MEGADRRNEGDPCSVIFPLFTEIYLFNQMVQAQRVRDQQILDLTRTMDITYSFVVSADELKNHPVLQGIFEQILKQTIECSYFIQGYM